MKLLCILSIVFVVSFVVWDRLTRKYVNFWRLIFVCGPKGSGKTSDMSKRLVKAKRSGQTVYCNVRVPGCYYIEADKDIGKYEFEENSLVLVDEAGSIWDKRSYKDFPAYVRNWFQLQRHYKLTVVLYSQDWDVDAKIRKLCDEMYILEKYFRVVSIGKGIYKKICINESTAEASSNVDHNLHYMPLLSPRSRTFTFIPKWAGIFDSFVAPKLPYKPFEYIEIPQELNKLYHIKKNENRDE